MASAPTSSNSRTGDHPATRPGDTLQARGIHGESPRSAEILEVLGRPGHERYRVRWEDGHESIVFPADGVSIINHTHQR